jgi:hypothetical protein
MTRKQTIAKLVAKDNEEPTFRMPTEVHEWIEQANSLIKYQKTVIADLKTEINELKTYKLWASKRLTELDRD